MRTPSVFALGLLALSGTVTTWGGSPWLVHEFAHVGAGAGIQSIILVLNPHEVAVPIAIDFFGDDGAPRQFTISGESSSHFERTVPAAGSLRLEIDSAGSAPVTGWSRLLADRTVGTQLLFQISSGGKLVTQAAVEPFRGVRLAEIFVDTQKGNTGLAICNVSDVGPVRIELRLKDESGDVVGTVYRKLPARGHLAQFVTELFENLGPMQGSLEITSSGKIVIVTLQQTELVLGTLPVVTSGGEDWHR